MATHSFQGLDQLADLELYGNRITKIAPSGFQGLDQLVALNLSNNQISTIGDRAFSDAGKLVRLWLMGNELDSLNLTGATFENLGGPCEQFLISLRGICLDGGSIVSLVLDDARLDSRSFDAVLGALHKSFTDDGQRLRGTAPVLTSTALVGLTFSDGNPASLMGLLSIEPLTNITLDQGLHDLYADELNAFAVEDGNTLTVIHYGDTDADGDVDFPDFLKLASKFGGPGRWSDGDFDRDGTVEFPDFLKLAENFGKHGKPASVPEPAGVVLVTVALIVMGAHGRRRYS